MTIAPTVTATADLCRAGLHDLSDPKIGRKRPGKGRECVPCKAARWVARKAENAAYRAANAERIRERAKKHQDANREKYREQEKAYRAANPERLRIRTARRRALKAGVETEPFTLWDVLDRDGFACSLCGGPLDPALIGLPSTDPRWPDVPSREHTIALSRGGPDTLDNCTAAHVRCNSGKRDR